MTAPDKPMGLKPNAHCSHRWDYRTDENGEPLFFECFDCHLILTVSEKETDCLKAQVEELKKQLSGPTGQGFFEYESHLEKELSQAMKLIERLVSQTSGLLLILENVPGVSLDTISMQIAIKEAEAFLKGKP